MYYSPGLTADAPRHVVGHDLGDESSCDWGAEMFLGWNPRSEQYQCTSCPPGHRPAFAQCVPVHSNESPLAHGKSGGR